MAPTINWVNLAGAVVGRPQCERYRSHPIRYFFLPIALREHSQPLCRQHIFTHTYNVKVDTHLSCPVPDAYSVCVSDLILPLAATLFAVVT